jgi:ferredoxin
MKKICQVTAETLPTLEDVKNKPESKCPVAWAAEIARTAHNSSCGHGTYCRDGLYQLFLIPEDISAGRGSVEDLDMLKDCCDLIIMGNDCELSVQAATLVKALLELYAEEWRNHITRKRCAALECIACYALYIDPALCDGCGKCLAAAPSGVIAGGEGMIHVVKKDDPSIKTPEFMAICPKAAIKKTGPIKPPCPVDPVPVGSFGNAAAGGRRRRRG